MEMEVSKMKLIRVKYGKKDTPIENREYQIDGKGPVGTIKEFQKTFPDVDKFLIFEGDELMNTVNKRYKLQANNSAFNGELQEWEASESEYEFAKHAPFLRNLKVLEVLK